MALLNTDKVELLNSIQAFSLQEGLDGGLSRTVNIKFFSKLTVTVKNLT